MRIDDENKVVWCSESEMGWYTGFNLSVGNSMFLNLRRINALSTEKEVWLPNHMSITDRIEVIRAISDNYTFKLEEQEYYWRKKKEHLAWFENHENFYLTKDFIEKVGLDNLENEGTYKWYKFSEDLAKSLLKDDFDKFEKVECE